MVFAYQRTVRFQDTDAAGVVYFANVLAMCHEAYEASLAASGIELQAFFGGWDTAFAIAHASVDFFKPMVCGDRLIIHLTPNPTSRSEFEISYQVFMADTTQKPLSKAFTRHVCIDTATRTRQDLPHPIITWLNQWGETAPSPSSLAD
ncbi:MAG: acyl-CoA thioesterase [Leptolyngbyaceae cyanobacterium RU_5_1]|nr:acyl-CoA thioesterase [Leptolyngbyaceae cyanobacterium RU_5_1]